MGSASACCDDSGLKKGPWTAEEDEKLVKNMEMCGGDGSHHHHRGRISWRQVPKLAGLKRCGKSCRLRWTNYLRPDIKRGNFSHQEEETIINLHKLLGNKWSAIARNLPGRTDNEIKNFWNTRLKKKLLQIGIDPVTHTPLTTIHDHLSTIAASSTSFNPSDWALLQYLNSRIQELQNNIRQGQGLLISNETASDAYDQYRPCIPGMEREQAAAVDYYKYVLGSSLSSSSFLDQQPVYHPGHGIGYDYADLTNATTVNRHSNSFEGLSFGNTSEYDHHYSKFSIPNMRAPFSNEDDHELQYGHDDQGGTQDHQLPMLVSAATLPYATSTHDRYYRHYATNTNGSLPNSIHSSTKTTTISTATFQIDHEVACNGRNSIVMNDDHHQEATNDQSYWKHIME